MGQNPTEPQAYHEPQAPIHRREVLGTSIIFHVVNPNSTTIACRPAPSRTFDDAFLIEVAARGHRFVTIAIQRARPCSELWATEPLSHGCFLRKYRTQPSKDLFTASLGARNLLQSLVKGNG
jgi:hypothetical protein